MDNCDRECKGAENYTPVRIYNPSGLSSLEYRVGTHGRFKAQMLLDIASQKALERLTTRADSDLSIAILDSWATIADVLTFYQERIADEGFLRTAKERRSVLELARSIGYELRPGVAASTYLAFTMDNSPGSPKKVTIEKGTRIQSIPGQNELPQTFETIEEVVEARQEWSEMKPRLTEKQDLYGALERSELYFAGTAINLKAGDGLLFVIGGQPKAFRIVQAVEMEAEAKRTRVIIPRVKIIQNPGPGGAPPDNNDDDQSEEMTVDSDTRFTRSDLEAILSTTWTEADLQTKADLEGWSVDEIVYAVNSEREKEEEESNNYDGVYVFRSKCGVFGNNAPLWASLPPELRYTYTPSTRFTDLPANTITGPYSTHWDTANGVVVNTNSAGEPYGQGTTNEGKQIYLDNIYQGILPESWIVLQNSAKIVSAYKVSATSEKTMADFALTARVTELTLVDKTWSNVSTNSPEEQSPIALTSFKFRDTTVYGQPEKLALSEIPIKAAIKDDEIILDRMVGGLQAGRPILVAGELEEQAGIIKSEVVFLDNIVHFETDKVTTLKLLTSTPLKYGYKRDTVKINANIAEATHGETKEEAIGSGDPTQRFQQFALKQSPLTYVPASTPSGIKSTLEVTIGGVTWKEASSFEGLAYSDNAYVKRTSDEGKTSVIFGDGVNGRLPASGLENIKAKYRVGIGSSGLLDANKLTLLMKRPLGVRSVTNPLKTTGGTDPEKLDDARKNSPRTVLTLDRVVSLEDFKSFAQGFAGIGKATAYIVRIGGADVVLVAVASSDGGEVDASRKLDLVEAIESYKDPTAQFAVKSFNKKTFNVEAKIMVSSDRNLEDVKAQVESALKDMFSFERRDFGQAVTISEVMSVMQGVEGVEAVDVDYLYEYNPDQDLDLQKVREVIIRAKGVKEEEDNGDGVIIPSLLLINTKGIVLEAMPET